MAVAGRTRVLIVDDSAVMRSLLRSVVSADARLEVAGTAADGASALGSIGLLRPDLILMDVEMPVMDGLRTLKELRRRGHKMPVIMCSALTRRGAKVTLEALAGGASDYVAKPAGQANREAAMKSLSLELGPKIHALTDSRTDAIAASNSGFQPSGHFPSHSGPAAPLGLAAQLGIGSPFASASPRGLLAQPISLRTSAPSSTPTVLVIGVSTGGPAALELVLPALPANFPLPVLIVQHMPEVFTRLFAERLDGRCQLRVREAAGGEPVQPRTITIAKGNWHMEVRPASRSAMPPSLHLTQGPLENHCRPAVDVLFRSVAAIYGPGVLAVVLTGMGSDGMVGCRSIREHGGIVLAQDQATSTVWGMPGAVVNAGLAHRILPLNDVIPEILRLTSRTHSEARELRESAV